MRYMCPLKPTVEKCVKKKIEAKVTFIRRTQPGNRQKKGGFASESTSAF